MTPERRKEILLIASLYGSSGEGSTGKSLSGMLLELLDELDLRNEQIRIAKQLLGELSSGLGDVSNRLDGLQK